MGGWDGEGGGGTWWPIEMGYNDDGSSQVKVS